MNAPQYDAHGMRTDLGHMMCTADMMDQRNNARCRTHGRDTRPRCMLGCDPDKCPGPASGHHVFSFHHYQDEVSRTSKHPDAHADLVVKDALGLAGEAGEVVELIKKARFHGVPFDTEKLRSEIGDVLWYITDLCAQAGFTLADAAQANVAKLRARYPNGFVKGGGVR